MLAAMQHMAEQLQQQQIAGLQQMQQQLQEQQAQAMQALRDQLAAVAAAQPAVAAAPAAAIQMGGMQVVAPHAPRGAAPRLPPPAKFDGRTAALDEWISEINSQFDWYHATGVMTTEAEQVMFAKTYLALGARTWWEAKLTKPTSWAGMQDALLLRFQPVNSEELARAKLLALVQGKRSVHDFVDAFRSLVVRVKDMHKKDQLFRFLRALRPELAQTIRVQGVATLDAAIDMAVRVGALHNLCNRARRHTCTALYI